MADPEAMDWAVRKSRCRVRADGVIEIVYVRKNARVAIVKV